MFNRCPVCGSKPIKQASDENGHLFWVKFDCRSVYERKTDDLYDWSEHSPCLGKPLALVLSANESFAKEMQESLQVDSIAAYSIKDAIPLFSKTNINAVVTDLFLPNEDIPRFFSMLKNLMVDLKTILCLPNSLALDMVSKQFSYDKGISKEQSFEGMVKEVNTFIAEDKK